VTVEKGSITINGTSLTCFNSKNGSFSVAIIPYTYENTNFNQLKEGDEVNLEFDVIGKYIQRIIRGYSE
jgi:riboflavin synthase